MAKFRLLQVRGGGEEEQHFMSKFRVPQVKGKIYHICMAKIRVPQVRGGYRYTTFVCKDKLPQVRGKIYNICIAKLRVSQIR